jgi:DNA-binding NtrC family response regulator
MSRVLVVDDVRGVRESVKIALEAAGHETEAVDNGRTALELLRKDSYDVLVTDIWMPGIDGLSLIKALRADCPGLRVFCMTGGGAHMTIEAASSLAEIWGAEQVFVKPFDETLLLSAIEGPAPDSGRVADRPQMS